MAPKRPTSSGSTDPKQQKIMNICGCRLPFRYEYRERESCVKIHLRTYLQFNTLHNVIVIISNIISIVINVIVIVLLMFPCVLISLHVFKA